MELTIAEVRCCLQVALLGAVTPNLRAVSVGINSEDFALTMYFYYENQFSEEEEELSSIVETEVFAYFPNINADVMRFVLPIHEKVPEADLMVYHRYENVIHD